MVVSAALLLLQAVMLDLPNVDRNPYTTAEDVALGRKLYAGRCAGCHGPAGDGGKGANLATPTLSRAQGDLALYRVIRYGLPETEMPSHNMTQREIWQMAAYVRTLGQTPAGALTGDMKRGSEIFSGKGGCRNCHLVNGVGGHTGPALTDIGQRRSPLYLKTKLMDPAAGLNDFSMVSLTTRAGASVSGVRLNEDTFSIQLRDMQGINHSFWKDDLKSLKVEQRTVMPSYKNRLSEQEISDVTAWLSSLRGQQ